MSKKRKSTKRIWLLLPVGLLGLLALVFGASITGAHQEVNYDFRNPDVVKEWPLVAAGSTSVSPEGLAIAKGRFRILSPAPGSSAYLGSNFSWSQFPYVRIELAKSPRERQLTFRWNPENSLAKSYGFPLTIPANTDVFVFNTHALKFANSRFSARTYPIVQFGFEATEDFQVEAGDYLIRSVTLVSSLSPAETWQLVANNFLEPEVFYASAVNFLSGFYIFEKPVVFYFGLTLLLGAAIVAFFSKNRVAIAALVGTALLFQLILDMQFNVTLWNHAEYSHQRSAWHESQNDEHASRFGKDFAALAKAFEEQVPRGSKVYFPQETLHTVWAETNWIAFQYYPAYQSVGLADADYIFHYYPNAYELQTKGAHLQTLFEVSSNAKLLRVIRG
jgi:hypothetical protein